MNPAYLEIRDISSLNDVLTYIKSAKNLKDLAVFFDWDDTLVNPDYDTIIEPNVTRELFGYMKRNNIFHCIITGRFCDYVCDDKKINLDDMKHNIVNTIYPSLNDLGVDTTEYLKPEYTNTLYKIYNKYNIPVGVMYMGIIFTGKKGETMKNYFRQLGINKNHVLFVDDYEPYLIETTSSFPTIKAFRRHVSYLQ